MLNVHYTVDVEVWCEGWEHLDREFPAGFASHIHGRTPQGDFGVGYQAQLLQQHGLRGVFFIEPLFATRFGPEPLREVVAMVQEAGQDVQLHLHTEWLDEALEPLFPGVTHKRQYLRMLSREEQTAVIGLGLQLLREAGAERVDAFRAGNFGFNLDSLAALEAHGIRHDSSYNACIWARESGLRPGESLLGPIPHGAALIEHPVTVYRDGRGQLRPLQLTACAWVEMEDMLWQALEAGWHEVVIVSHGFELLDGTRRRLDPIAQKRFVSLCEFLARHRDQFRCDAFTVPPPPKLGPQPALLRSAFWRAARRLGEQGWRRLAY